MRDPDSVDVSDDLPPWRDWIDRARDAVDRVRRNLDADLALQASMAGLIELAATRYAVDPGAQWRPGEPLKLLFAGYTGTRNTGADVRVQEMIRQVRHLLGEAHSELYVTTIDPARSQGYYRGVVQLELPQIYPKFVLDTVHEVHGVVACEGSMFKSKFANALSTYMVGALGCAGAENKLAIGWGGEAGHMDESLEALVSRYCADALVMCRNEESQRLLRGLGVPAKAGTDTAWTYDPGPLEPGREHLRALGWDGHTPVVVLCPVNPFWWPVKPDVGRGLLHAVTGAYAAEHYKSVYFHHAGPEVEAQLGDYLDRWAAGVRAVQRQRSIFPVVVGMEALDRVACEGLAERLGGAPVVVSDEHAMVPMVRLIRCASALISSRYHAIVCTMAARVPSAGITMDERIRNLMADRGTPELALEVGDPDLAPKVERTLGRLLSEGDAVADGIGRCVVENLVRMGQMGQTFIEYLRERHPAFPIRPELGAHGDPWDHLPRLPRVVEDLVVDFT